jgi:hypothetical protein
MVSENDTMIPPGDHADAARIDPAWIDRPEMSLSRPFLDRIAKGLSDAGVVSPDHGIRPYFVTRGRTRSRNRTVSFETIVARRHDGPSLTQLDDEQRMVAIKAETPHSMAELSALLHLPIGVIWVLAGDLAEDGFLTVHAAPADVLDDIELIDSLIEGLRRL